MADAGATAGVLLAAGMRPIAAMAGGIEAEPEEKQKQ